MTDRSRIAMLLGLIGLVVAITTLSSAFDALGRIVDHAFPWVALAIVFFIVSKKGGCCRSRSKENCRS